MKTYFVLNYQKTIVHGCPAFFLQISTLLWLRPPRGSEEERRTREEQEGNKRRTQGGPGGEQGKWKDTRRTKRRQKGTTGRTRGEQEKDKGRTREVQEEDRGRTRGGPKEDKRKTRGEQEELTLCLHFCKRFLKLSKGGRRWSAAGVFDDLLA